MSGMSVGGGQYLGLIDTSGIEMDVRLAEAVARRIAAWMDTAAQAQRNADFYRGLVDECAKHLGPRAFTVAQWHALQDALPTHLRQMARFAIATGLRRHNVTHLEWPQIDLDRAVAFVDADETKSGSAIGVPLSDEAVAVLREQVGAHPVIVFPYRGKPVFKTSTRAWRHACEAAGVPDLTWHDLRHIWASAHMMAGTSLAELLALGGWKTPRMGLRYAHLSPEHLAGVAGNSRLVDVEKKRKA